MKTIWISLFIIIILSCSENNSTGPGQLNVIKTTTLHAYDYASNFFFLDTVYKSIYSDYFRNYTPVIPGTDIAKFNRIKELELWMSVNDVTQGAVSCNAVAFADLELLNIYSGEKYSSEMKNSGIYAGQIERGYWIKMDTTEYTFDPYIGIICINNLRTDRFYAVSYIIEGETKSIEDDLAFGNLSKQILEKDTVILKLIYRPNMQPVFKTLWERQLKNKYYIGEKFIDYSKSEVKLLWINENNDTLDYLNNIDEKLVTILRVDNINNSTGSPPLDGKFDLRAWTLDEQTGVITFPSLEPFEESIIEWFYKINQLEKAFQYIYPDIYDTTKNAAKSAIERDKYLIVFNKLGK